MNRTETLQAAIDMDATRQQESRYGDFHELCAMFGQHARDFFLKYRMHERYSDAHNGGMLLGILKDCRILNGFYHEDNYVDGINYRAQANSSQSFDTTVKNTVGPAENPVNECGHTDEEHKELGILLASMVSKMTHKLKPDISLTDESKKTVLESIIGTKALPNDFADWARLGEEKGWINISVS